MERAIDVANYFLEKEKQEGAKPGITPMKLTKLVFIAHGWYLAINDKPLIDENAMAWKYGPVIVSVYLQFRCYKNQVINLVREFDYNFKQINDKDTKKLLDKVYDVYKGYTAIQLSEITHRPGSPWAETVRLNEYGSLIRNLQIPDNLILRYYRDRLNHNNK